MIAYEHDGFFGPMDTIKDRQRLETLHETGAAPWMLAAERAGIGTPKTA